MGLWNALPIELENRLNAKMFDGRLIHFHLQFVEPLRRAREVSCTLDTSGFVDLPPRTDDQIRIVPVRTALADLRNAPDPGFDLEPFLRAPSYLEVASDFPVAVLELRDGALRMNTCHPAGAEKIEAIEAALGLLSEVGLAFLVELAVGVVNVGGVSAAPLPAYVIRVDVSGSQSHDAARLVEAAAEQLAWVWIDEETRLETSLPADRSDPRLMFLATLYAECVVSELHQRLDDRGWLPSAQREAWQAWIWRHRRTVPNLLQLLDEVPGVPLTKELACIWTPGWRRSAFIYDSPFDHIKELPLPHSHGSPVATFLKLRDRDIFASLFEGQ
ncbi:hypothetical protein ACFPOI_43750 [Nonomuraea angiospora]|uniref:Uncharacterized protein n=1 Tax=Nonomuraea angiospora TaxID=46172 RepID=A0ABR9LNQ6_9ACTN|nr:hypothetical protein [Nonomuraea angiospora]MBE1582294.1 hypothetical protein [Nonomuraea angiospora]